MEFSAQQIADFLNGEVIGDKDIKVNNFSKIEEGKPHTITFLANPKYTHYIYETEADIVLVSKAFVPDREVKATIIKVDDAYQAISRLLTLAQNAKPSKTGISPKADIAESAVVGQDVFVGAFASIGEHCKIGNNVKIYQNVQIADYVVIGDNTVIYPNVSVYDHCVIGADNIIHAGAVIGADGFGFAPDQQGHYDKIPQIGGDWGKYHYRQSHNGFYRHRQRSQDRQPRADSPQCGDRRPHGYCCPERYSRFYQGG